MCSVRSGRHQLTPDEIRRRPRDRELVFIKGAYLLNLRRPNYLTDREYAGRSDANPLRARCPIA
jgi:type IV secretory pathway TraG/TraD family ATPase VirD4